MGNERASPAFTGPLGNSSTPAVASGPGQPGSENSGNFGTRQGNNISNLRVRLREEFEADQDIESDTRVSALEPQSHPASRASPPRKRRRNSANIRNTTGFIDHNHNTNGGNHRQPTGGMRLSQHEFEEPVESDEMVLDAPQSVASSSMAPGASSAASEDPVQSTKNGHFKALSNGSTNGSLSPLAERYSNAPIARVNPPGTTLYPGSNTNREEFVRLVIQTLKDVGYV